MIGPSGHWPGQPDSWMRTPLPTGPSTTNPEHTPLKMTNHPPRLEQGEPLSRCWGACIERVLHICCRGASQPSFPSPTPGGKIRPQIIRVSPSSTLAALSLALPLPAASMQCGTHRAASHLAPAREARATQPPRPSPVFHILPFGEMCQSLRRRRAPRQVAGTPSQPRPNPAKIIYCQMKYRFEYTPPGRVERHSLQMPTESLRGAGAPPGH